MALPASHTVQFLTMIILAIMITSGATLAITLNLRNRRVPRASKVNSVLSGAGLILVGSALALNAFVLSYGGVFVANLLAICALTLSGIGFLFVSISLTRQLLSIVQRQH